MIATGYESFDEEALTACIDYTTNLLNMDIITDKRQILIIDLGQMTLEKIRREQ